MAAALAGSLAGVHAAGAAVPGGTAVPEGSAAAHGALDRIVGGQHGALAGRTDAQISANWSGMIDEGGTFTGVSAGWGSSPPSSPARTPPTRPRGSASTV